MAGIFKIAVVDDDKHLAENIKDIFELASYQVAVANSGKEALVLFKQEPFDLAFVDVKLPDTAGQELVKKLTLPAPATEFIMITGNASLESAIESVKVPQVIGYEIKPVNMDRLLSFVYQVAARKKAQQEVRENRVALKRLLSNLPGMAYRCKNDFKWSMEFVSEGCRQLTGYNRDEVENNRVVAFGDLIAASHRKKVWDEVQAALGVKDHFQIKYPLIDKNGRTRWVWEKGIGVMTDDDSEGIDCIEGFIMDITREKDMEAQLQHAHKMEAIGTLSGGIAHDFNNILGIILGNMELAMDDVPDWNPARLNLQEIKTATLRAKDVVRQLLSFSRKTEVNRKPIAINALAGESVALLRASIPTTIEIKSKIPETLPAIDADATQIQQIILNLSTNGAHAMENRQGTLTISLDTMHLQKEFQLSQHFKKMPPGEYVRLTVHDTGGGIDPAIMEKIFDPYFTTKDVGKGTGLGLAVVHGIVSNHDGAIAIDSSPEKGTKVHVIFPAVPHGPGTVPATDHAIPGGNEHILFVDDEPSLLKLAHKMLERLGYKVTCHNTPRNALAQFTTTPRDFDLVITDMTMADLSGDELARNLLEIRPEIPIILCTGFTEKINALDAASLGIRRFLAKPLDRHELATAVREVLDGSN
ncbi:Signal transduction histidine kinase [Desulfocicer vacuolatum DSM 3385]|uniref:histidine kinase n=2 Tax=Desulfocicer vacuolatum TaxID=2298 RepID=A0A1W2B8L8_9BACT|nr:Signal transduction histidine kinase [Desulfocicer vacuolatum DSM 3385]